MELSLRAGFSPRGICFSPPPEEAFEEKADPSVALGRAAPSRSFVMTIHTKKRCLTLPVPGSVLTDTQTLRSRFLCLAAVLLALFACCPTLQSAATPPNTFLIVSDIHFN